MRAWRALGLILIAYAGTAFIAPASAQEGVPLATPIAAVDAPDEETTEPEANEPQLDQPAEPTAEPADSTFAATPPPTGDKPLTLTVTQGRDVSFGLLAAPSDGDGSAPPTYVMTDAVTVEVSGGTGPWVVTCTVIGAAEGIVLSWQLAGASGWTPFGDGPCYTALDGGDRTLTFHYRLHVDPTADPGPFAFEVVYEVNPL